MKSLKQHITESFQSQKLNEAKEINVDSKIIDQILSDIKSDMQGGQYLIDKHTRLQFEWQKAKKDKIFDYRILYTKHNETNVSKNELISFVQTKLLNLNINETKVNEAWGSKENARYDKQLKSFKDVKVGDIAMENPSAGGEWSNEIGEVKWKGNAKDAWKKFKSTIKGDWEIDDIDELEEISNEFVYVNDTWGGTLFAYDGDPSSTVVWKDEFMK